MEQRKKYVWPKIAIFMALATIGLLSGCYTPPKDIVLVNRAGELMVEGRYDECITTCNQALAINSSNYWAYGYRAGCYRGRGNYDQSIADYKKALQISPGDKASLMGLKTTLFFQEREAQSQYDPTLKPNRKDAGKESGAGSRIRSGIQLHRVLVNPQQVTPGSRFDLVIEFVASDTSTEQSHIPVLYHYVILEGQTVIFESKQKQVEAPNGQRTQRVVHLSAAKKKGFYKIEINLIYKSKMAGQRVGFEII